MEQNTLRKQRELTDRGTPMTISCTYAPLPEVSDVGRLTREAMDAAVDAGKFILFHDGEKVKVARGVNSLQTTTQDKGDAWKKIKMVEVMDMIQTGALPQGIPLPCETRRLYVFTSTSRVAAHDGLTPFRLDSAF